MSRDAAAFKSSVVRKPVQRLRSVALAPEAQSEAGQSPADGRVRGVKDLIYTLLREVQALEQERLLSDLRAPKTVRNLDIEKGIKFDDVVRQFESNIIQQALLITGGNQAKAARLLGIKANTLNYKVKLYNLL